VKLTDLEPHWVGHGGDSVVVTATGESIQRREAVALGFTCPCGNGEGVCLPLENPLDGGPRVEGFHAYWRREGESFETLTLTPSIQRRDVCRWHGFITSGEIVTA
jgi:hypothetical protein